MREHHEGVRAALDKTAGELGVTLPATVREIMAANAESHIRELVSGYRERVRWLDEKEVVSVTSSLEPARPKRSCAWLPNGPDLSGYLLRTIIVREKGRATGPGTRKQPPLTS